MLTKLRKDNMDKVDELLDRLPKTTNTTCSFNLISEITTMKKNRDGKTSEDKALSKYTFFLELKDQNKMDKLLPLFNNNLEKFIIDFMKDDMICPHVEKVSANIETIINCKLDISPYSEKRLDGKFQCLAEYIALDPKYDSLRVLSSYGCDEDFEIAKQKTLTKCIVVLLCHFVPTT